MLTLLDMPESAATRPNARAEIRDGGKRSTIYERLFQAIVRSRQMLGQHASRSEIIRMPSAKDRAASILRELERAEDELLGKCVVLTDGKAGTVERVLLDELHGLRVTIAGHDGAWPVSTIKFIER